MIPIVIDPARLALGLAGRGHGAARRVGQLVEGGAGALAVFSDRPGAALEAAAAGRLAPRLPLPADLGRLDVLWIVGLPAEEARALARQARQAGVLVNVEDDPGHSNFHSPSVVRRGDLVVAVSTGGRSPTLARRIRRQLEAALVPDWSRRLADLGRRREDWRREGLGMAEVARRSEALIVREGWLP